MPVFVVYVYLSCLFFLPVEIEGGYFLSINFKKCCVFELVVSKRNEICLEFNIWGFFQNKKNQIMFSMKFGDRMFCRKNR